MNTSIIHYSATWQTINSRRVPPRVSLPLTTSTPSKFTLVCPSHEPMCFHSCTLSPMYIQNMESQRGLSDESLCACRCPAQGCALLPKACTLRKEMQARQPYKPWPKLPSSKRKIYKHGPPGSSLSRPLSKREGAIRVTRLCFHVTRLVMGWVGISSFSQESFPDSSAPS